MMKKSWFALCLTGLLWPSLTISSPIEPGYILFKTQEGAEVDLGTIKVTLIGNPKPLASEKLGVTDTIIERKSGIDPFEKGGSGTIDTEVVALSLKSFESFDAGELPPGPSGEKFPAGTMVDLYVVINKLGLPGLPETNLTPPILEPSIGEMTINHENADGEKQVEGTFSSNFPAIQALLIFVKAGGKLSKPEDWLASMPDPKPISLSSTGWWSHKPHNQALEDLYNEKYPAGKFYITSPGKGIPPIKHKGPHPVDPNPVTFTKSFTATKLAGHSVQLIWETGMEKDLAGFAVYRGELKDQEGECTDNADDYATLTMIAWEDSQGGLEGTSYSVMDSSGKDQGCYGLVATEFDGTSEVQVTKISD